LWTGQLIFEQARVALSAQDLSAVGARARSRVKALSALRAFDFDGRDDFSQRVRRDARGLLLFRRQRVVALRAGQRRAPKVGEAARRALARK
jgi:hypothetical protein